MLKKAAYLLIWVCVINTIPIWFSDAAESKYYAKSPITLSANDVLSKDLLQGGNYRVEQKVKNDGLISTYVLTTNYGPLTVESTGDLLIRINELKALSIMEEMDRKKVFGDALVSGVKGTVKGAAEFVKSPIESSKNLVKGTGQFISNLGESIFSDDPDQDNVVKVALGYDAAKRHFAFEFGIDPYTDYAPVVERLGEIARAAVAGGITPKVAMAAVDNPVVLAARVSGTAYGMMQLVRDNPPGKLREINREKLEKMDLDASLIEAFLDNHNYTPLEETLLVGELERMKGVKNFDVFVSNASLATGKPMALSYRIRAQMMAGYHAKVSPADQFRNIDGVLALQLKNGVYVVLAPADFVFWTKRLENKVNSLETALNKMAGISGKEFWITGKFDPTARKNFESKGWMLKENANAIFFK